MGTRIIATLLLVATLTGCDGTPSAAPPAPVVESTPTSHEAIARRPIPPRLRVSLSATAPRQRTERLVIDLAEAAQARTVEQAPVGRGMLMAQLNPFAPGDAPTGVDPGQPYLMTRAGAWRRFDLARYGLEVPAYGELSMAISPDGRHVALADPSGLVTVDLRDNRFSRFDLPVREALVVEWSPDASTLLIKDRHSRRRPCGPQGCALDVATGRLVPVSFNLFSSTRGDGGAMVEVVPPGGGRPAQIATHLDGAAPSAVPVQYRTAVSTAGGPAAARYVAYAQCTHLRRVRHAGVVVADPSSGRVVAMLENDRRPACRLGARSWVDDRRLLVDDWTTGDLWLWDVIGRRVQRVAVGRTAGVNLEIAGDVVVSRLSR